MTKQTNEKIIKLSIKVNKERNINEYRITGIRFVNIVKPK